MPIQNRLTILSPKKTEKQVNCGYKKLRIIYIIRPKVMKLRVKKFFFLFPTRCSVPALKPRLIRIAHCAAHSGGGAPAPNKTFPIPQAELETSG